MYRVHSMYCTVCTIVLLALINTNTVRCPAKSRVHSLLVQSSNCICMYVALYNTIQYLTVVELFESVEGEKISKTLHRSPPSSTKQQALFIYIAQTRRIHRFSAANTHPVYPRRPTRLQLQMAPNSHPSVYAVVCSTIPRALDPPALSETASLRLG